MGTLIAYNGNGYKYLGYAISAEFDGLFIGVKESPVIVVEGVMMIGVLNNRYLQQYLMINKHNIPDQSYKSVLTSFDFIREFEVFHSGEMLIMMASGDIFYWRDRIMYNIKANYMSIGDGRDVAMGCMYGIRSSEYDDLTRVEITLKAVSYNRPNQAMSTGYERI